MTHKQLAWAVGSNTNLIVLLGLDFNAPPRPAFFPPFPVATQSQSLISPPYACLCPICLGSFYTICWAVHVSFLSPGPPLQHTRAQDLEEGRASFTSWSVSVPCPPQTDTKGTFRKREEGPVGNPPCTLLSPLRVPTEKTWLSLGLQSCRFR